MVGHHDSARAGIIQRGNLPVCPSVQRGVTCGLPGGAAPLLLAGLLAAACGGVSAGHGAAGETPVVRGTESPIPGATVWPVIRGVPVRSTIVINAGTGETFAPPPTGAKPKLTGVQAWDESFLGGDKNKPRPIPADVSYQLGMLTVPPSVTDVLAWGYSGPPGPCPVIGGLRPSGRPAPAPSPSPPQRCIGWTFINAGTASNPEGTWQPLGTPPPSPAPAPSSVIALRSGGFLDASQERFSPQRLVMQGPLSTIRWTFDSTSCSISLYWFWPPQAQRGPACAACPWKHAFSVSVISDFTGRGHVFSVIGGCVAHREGQLVRAVLADGQTQIYDAEGAGGAWLFAVQRCGHYPGTALRTVEEITRTGKVIARLPVPAALHPAADTGCGS